ncbi:50S ribosomal protein L21 [bacterium]|nr:50S ribosomal protein L21 [bacterium]
MYAIVEIAGKQYKVAKNDKIEVDKLDTEKGKVIFDTVLLYAENEKSIKVGNPYVAGAKVEAEVIEHKRGDKIRVFKMKPKKRYQKTIGHRRDLSVLEIKDIKIGITTKKETTAKPKEESVKKETTTEKPATKKTEDKK